MSEVELLPGRFATGRVIHRVGPTEEAVTTIWWYSVAGRGAEFGFRLDGPPPTSVR